jgi:hypothetical protein
VGHALKVFTIKVGVNGLKWKRGWEIGGSRGKQKGEEAEKREGEQGHQESNLDPPS